MAEKESTSLLWRLGVPTAVVGGLIALVFSRGEKVIDQSYSKRTERVQLYETIAGPTLRFNDFVCATSQILSDNWTPDSAKVYRFAALGDSLSRELRAMRPGVSTAYGELGTAYLDSLTTNVSMARDVTAGIAMSGTRFGGLGGNRLDAARTMCDKVSYFLGKLESQSQ
jgi:hypothetical protein